ncbi:bifunctional DNA-formamidopyrimidine glycosylase/DNA-(apurinic or apyrimidinic site) lyase [candidate division KSB1 bacterium]|nr:bifunctional DNA-formamidopyrimidine glycosylase/DNA-(apurinic or apyrimidinic site) lyase [candidate division KSB1 bacterium]RQW04120.1 MAG: bifunctional DNA-formamidopyrimidine glycosylase/DNA-(apurinic or apyrimidinic site) lyase [candidate division KSB1 bacterium]
MPELPEVETLRRGIKSFLINKTIESVNIIDRRLRWPIIPEHFFTWVVGKKVARITRRAKYLLWHLENDAVVVIHLGMSGRLGLFENSAPIEKHTHVIFQLRERMQVRFRDPRRFGLIEVVPPGQIKSYIRFKNLGVEPLSAAFAVNKVTNVLKKSKKPIKNWIMDAQNIVGVGNIYANEALFFAGIHPTRPAHSLKSDEQRRLVQSVKSVLTTAIKMGGTTLNDFRNARSEPGFFQLELAVYQRSGQACHSCGATIERIVMSGRSTFYCPSCQH